MYMLTVIITTSNLAQPIIPRNAGVYNSNTCFQSIIPQARSTNAAIIYLGSNTATNLVDSLEFPPSNSGGSMASFSPPGDLRDFYVYGTAGDRLVIMVIP